MASNTRDAVEDPSADERANYDYVSDDVDRPGLVSDLETLVAGDVRFDSYTRQQYATDASAYEKTPIGVVMPESTEDVVAVVEYCAEREIPVLPRGGGTSLAGQTVNEAVVLDLMKHMDEVRSIDPDAETARAQVGARLGDLNAELKPHGLKFAPDPAWGDKSALGGAIGNNSTGSHSLKYGKTDYYLEEAEVVLADGTVTTFGEVSVETLREEGDSEGDLEARIYAEVARILDEEAEEIAEAYPDLKRNVSGYNLDMLVDEMRGERRLPDDSGVDPESEPGTVNLARLLAGSEGTLAIVTEATVSLEPIPNTASVALLTYPDVVSAMEDVAPILEHDPAAVEVMDDVLLDLARNTAEFKDVVGMLPDGTDAVLLVEFYAEDDEEGRRKVANLVADRAPASDSVADPAAGAAETTRKPPTALTAMEAHDAETRAKFWKMRKSGLPILLSRTTDEKHVAYIEDTAIPAENLPAYVSDVQEILDEYDTFASYYAHAGPGVLHIRPLVNTKTVEGLAEFEAIADEMTDLVVKYGGSVSGEHGDGRARTQWNRKLYGDDLWRTFRDLKSAFDPDWLLNPGNICGDHDMTENLRFSPDYEFDAGFDPSLNWENENGFQGMAELCHGCAGCRGPQETTGGVMCPTFRAEEEEVLSTRGRANMLRQAMSGGLPEEEMFEDEFVHEVLDLCIGCKGCTKDCPSEVDMAKMRTEVLHEHHQRNGSSLRDRMFANIETLSKVGSALAPLSNVASKVPGARTVMEKTLGIAKERELPTFHRETFVEWFDGRGRSGVPEAQADRKVLLFPDTYTNYNHPDAGKAAVRALEAAGVHVRIPDGVADSGRPAHSKGFIDRARRAAERNVAVLSPLVAEGWDVVVVEPSDAVMFQHDYLDLLSGESVERVAASTYGVMEYFDTFDLLADPLVEPNAPSLKLTYHGHCHQKSTKKDHHAVAVLDEAGYRVDPLDSTCCGMAGSFGYEAEHYSMSKAIGEVLSEQVAASDGDTVVAPGASCRSQIGEFDGETEEPPHPVEMLADALV
ncbi:FAD-binding and (Fe-S)-binding domain-containing protein [Halopelagius longus]|uniref:D-lactate dehydrogenase (cytochrome) n=1 Tax=Halopelagius longus TaxID=1236180 RepID=A0A1H1A9Z8_9EURY|nr:FAD-binding and (Fe-S)-binding domain-containing protein [Halopelagius longus]RDI70299.1 FAD-binding oxidoreductase [Halopelagius longus]SDQ36503.1 FAD/FMN-containing dehydrogenase [Halopelagius longus]